MACIYKGGYEIELGAPSQLMVTYKIGELGLATQALLAAAGAENRLELTVTAAGAAGHIFPTVADGRSYVAAERMNEAEWFVAARLAKPHSGYSNPIITSALYSIGSSQEDRPTHIADLWRDFYTYTDAAGRYNPAQPNRKSRTASAALSSLIFSIDTLRRNLPELHSSLEVE